MRRNSVLYSNSRVAQWKRAGPITHRSEDRNLALLCFLFFYQFLSALFTRPKISHEKELSPVQQQQSGAVEVCCAHYPEVRGSKPRSAIFTFLLPSFICAIYKRSKINHEKELSAVQQQQSGAIEVCWAHNPEVQGSKPRYVMISFLLPVFALRYLQDQK